MWRLHLLQALLFAFFASTVSANYDYGEMNYQGRTVTVTYTGYAWYYDENGVLGEMRVEDCEFGCAEAMKCASKWTCKTESIFYFVLAGAVSLLLIIVCICQCIKRRGETEDDGYLRIS